MRAREFEKLIAPLREKAKVLEAEAQAIFRDTRLSDDQQEAVDDFCGHMTDAAMGHG